MLAATEHIEDDVYFKSSNQPGGEDDGLEEDDWEADMDDENYEDELEDENDLREIRVGRNLSEPDPEDDDHLPDDDW